MKYTVQVNVNASYATWSHLNKFCQLIVPKPKLSCRWNRKFVKLWCILITLIYTRILCINVTKNCP